MRKLVASVAAALGLMVAVAAHAYQTETVKDGGNITGTVKYGGPAPSPEPLEITKDRDVCGTYLVYDQSLLVGQQGGLANAVVTLSGVAKGEPMQPDPAVRFDQKGCEYVPRVAVFPAGSTLQIINSDGILHNIHTESKINPVIDIAQPGFKKQIDVTIEKPEIIKVSCDAHNWMEGWWYVTSNPYYAITDASGHFKITDIPQGTYTLKVWQERLGMETQTVTVRPGAVTVVNLTMKPAADQTNSNRGTPRS
jgi:hypothetical protein